MSIRSFILSNDITRELFFFVRHKKVNKKNIEKQILKLNKIALSKKEVPVYISLTTYGERLNELSFVLYSFVKQTIKPEKIIVNLAKKDFDNISTKLKIFESYGVEFRECEDLKSYKKLIPTLEKNPDKFIVTADDDLYYPKNWLKDIWESHIQNPNCIVCKLTKSITFDVNGKISSYNDMKYNKNKVSASYRNFILSGGGTLFPPNCLYKDAINPELFQKLCPYADDIWDWFMAILNGTKIVQTKKPYVNVCYVNPYREYGITEGKTLTQINVDQNKNDEQFRNMMIYYNLDDSKIKTMLDN